LAKRVLIVGLGVFGKAMAIQLFKANVDVIAIDKDLDLVDDVKDSVTMAVKMDATDEHALNTIDLNDVDIAMVTIGENFEANLLAAVTLKELGVKKVIARASKSIQKKIMLKAGVDLIITPEEIVAHILAQDFSNGTTIVESYVEKLGLLDK
jgi:trk system potassium uptake protein TrkA